MLDPARLAGVPVVVTGARVAGVAAARALLALGARVLLADSDPVLLAAAAAELGVPGHDATAALPEGTALVVTSPGWRPDAPLLAAAAAAGVPVWGDVELAWRCDAAEVFGPRRTWLAVTGTNGKTTTTTMLLSVLLAAGRRAAACGNVGLPVLDALRDPAGPEVLAVELSSFQLAWAPSVRPHAGVVLNIAEDHLDWHGTMAAYVAAKAQVLTGGVAVLGRDDPVAAGLGDRAAGRVVGFRMGEPGPGELGVVGDDLVDRAFGDGPVVLAAVADVTPPGPPTTLDALAAAALARTVGVGPAAVSAGLRAHAPGAHRSVVVAVHDGVRYVDDSKATNPHAALASLEAAAQVGSGRVVWVAGGLLKGASVEELVRTVAPLLRGVVLLGRDRGVVAAALARHAPDVPTHDVRSRDDDDMHLAASSVMSEVVAAAAAWAGPGDTVLLAPAAASMDMFTDYGHRGRAFAAAAEAAGTAG
ncbi:UDP-N-acetylmuramoyl-L-alanine--D-glutamate ligase [Rhodococcus aerolatus]